MMNEEKDITKSFLRVDKIVNTIRCLNEFVNDSIVVKKVLRSIPTKFNGKVSNFEEMQDLNTLTTDQLHGTLIAYAKRTTKGKSTSKEETFKDDKKTKEDQEDSSYGYGKEEAKCVIRLKRSLTNTMVSCLSNVSIMKNWSLCI